MSERQRCKHHTHAHLPAVPHCPTPAPCLCLHSSHSKARTMMRRKPGTSRCSSLDRPCSNGGDVGGRSVASRHTACRRATMHATTPPTCAHQAVALGAEGIPNVLALVLRGRVGARCSVGGSRDHRRRRRCRLALEDVSLLELAATHSAQGLVLELGRGAGAEGNNGQGRK